MAADRFVGLGFVVLGMTMVWMTAQLEYPRLGQGDPGPRVFPIALGVLMAVLGAILSLRPLAPAVVDARTLEAAESATVVPPEPKLLRIAHLVNLIAYVALFERLGFSLSTFIFLTSAIFLLGRRNARGGAIAVLSGAIVTFVVGTGLKTGVGVPLPGVFPG